MGQSFGPANPVVPDTIESMRAFHCSWALALVLVAPAAAQQAQPEPGSTGYLIFSRGTAAGREDVTVQSTATGTMITSSGRSVAGQASFVLRRAEITVGTDWAPQRFALDASVNGADVTIRTLFDGATATTAGEQQGKQVTLTHQVDPRTVILPNNIYASYVGLARRLATATEGTELRAFVVPQAEVGIRVSAVASERVQIGTSFLNVRRYELTVANPGGDLTVTLIADEKGSLVRLAIAAGGLDVVREDLAASTSRAEVFSNPGDEAVLIPATGFNIGATITRPKAGAPRLPAVILLGGSAAADRDGVSAGIPIIGQLAGALADAGFLAVRYDKRGFGQSGGRSESATLSDYAEDVRSVVKWLQNRNDVDPKRIAIVGHGDGAWIGLQAAAREKKIAALVSIAAPASAGTDVVLEQQQKALDQLNLPPDDRERRVALQKQIQAAVLTGKGWDALPPQVRKEADTPWLQSFLTFNPATVIDDVRQPMFFVHGEIDRQVPVTHVDQLSGLARKGKSKSIEVLVVRGVNHLLVPAITGEVGEYGSLTDRNVSGEIRTAVSGWLAKTFAAIK
jgi:pimeloyl-ACP methyl ester carboxylesterase